jgi:hypothetical protein
MVEKLFVISLHRFRGECGYLPYAAEVKVDCGQELQSADTGSTIDVVQTRINTLGNEIKRSKYKRNCGSAHRHFYCNEGMF